MGATQTRTLTIFAPAKVNLYLHVTGRLENGYHTLDSLAAFADIGDSIAISPAPEFSFGVEGPCAAAFGPKERDASPDSSNLAVQAVWAFSRAAQKIPNLRVTLTKNLPLASGLGGGSADAAAVIWGLAEWWNIPRKAPWLHGLAARLGADIPVCLDCTPARMRGIGDILDPVPALPEIPVVLAHPGKPCRTAEVFSRFTGNFREPAALPEHWEDIDTLVAFLKDRDNDLLPAALQAAPAIGDVLDDLGGRKGCLLARMSGSGSACFGLFADEKHARKAAKAIARDNPGWWVKSGFLGRPERY